MIKVDIVNEVSRVADVTKVKAELAVDAVFEAMRHSMQRGERELRGLASFRSLETRHRPQSLHRQRRRSARPDDSFKPGKELQNIGQIGKTIRLPP